jgi:hypothetical protein
MQIAATDSLGQLTVIQTLPTINGGLGFSFTPTSTDANLVLAVNPLGTGLTFTAAIEPPTLKVLSFYRFI